jgi:hypothetical protein
MRKKLLQCPFCDNFLAPPIDIQFKSMELTGGICRCRAVYVFDRTGHNLGEIFLDALTFVCRGDIERALALNPEDYVTEDFDYDPYSNTVGRHPSKGRTGKLLFVKLKKNFEEL